MAKRKYTSKRRSLILKELEEYGQVSVNELSEKHKVSKVSIRNDLNKLATQGLLIRTAGGALFNKNSHANKPRIKSRYADEACRQVKNGESLMIPQSQYSLAIIERLIEWNKRLTIITNSIEISNKCRGYFECILLGGKVLENGSTLVDDQFINSYYSDKLLLEVDSISLKSGLFSTKEDTAKMYRAMINACEETLVIAPQELFSIKGKQRIASLEVVTKFITDYSPSPKDKSLLAQAEIKLLRVT